MFRKQEELVGHVATAPVATLSLDRAIAPPLRLPALDPAEFRRRARELDLVVDLGADLGSRRWWRGFATCLGLCTAAFHFAPFPAALDRPSGPVMGDVQYQETRADSFAPLAYGADTGRRLGATAAVEPLADTPERPRLDLSATLGRGDGFARTLERTGVSSAEALKVADMVAAAEPLGGIEPGTRVEIILGRRASRDLPRPLEHLLFRAAFDMRLAVERANGELVLRRLPIAVDDTPLRVTGRVGASLFRAARAAGAPASAVEAYLKAIATRASIGSLAAADRFDLIVAQRRADTGEVEMGQILYAGLERGRGSVKLMKWGTDERASWFDASGEGETKGAMTRPVYGTTTSSFGMRRHPLLGFTRFHKGMDIGAPMGAPIVAATDGVVRFAGWHGGHGNYVMLAHSGGMATGYAHMSRIVARVGAHVAQGQLIGYVGSTGLSTGPHLHYEVYRNGQAINPATMKFTTTMRLAGAELAKFKSRLAGLMAVRLGGTTRTAASGAGKPKG